MAEPALKIVEETQQGRWRRVCDRLRAELGEEVYTSWFQSLELMEVTAGRARLSVPTRFLRSWITEHFGRHLVQALATEFPGVVDAAVELRSSARAALAPAKSFAASTPKSGGAPRAAGSPGPRETPRPTFAHRPADGAAALGSPLDRRMTFSTFVVGQPNQLAFAAARKVADAEPGAPAPFNPLYVHASVGMGKTHMLQAIAHAASEVGRRVVYLTAERFMYGFVQALKAHTAIAFKEKLRAIDLLVIDDVQFLQGRTMEAEFCHTLNALIDSGKQIVIAADRPAAELESLEERVRSRLLGGLSVTIGAPTETVRMKILEIRVAQARREHSAPDVPRDVLAHVARLLATNGRDLEGAANRLAAHSALAGQPLTLAQAEAAIADLVRTAEPKRVKIEDIQKTVAMQYSVSRADLMSARRNAAVVKPRQIAMFLAKELTLRSLPEIGRRFGGRDHTTVLHAVRKIGELAKPAGPLCEEIERLRRLILE